MTVLKANNSILRANGKILVHPETSGNTVVIGGRTYPTVQIGGQIWMAENLDLKVQGIDINPAGAPSTPAAWYYDRDEATYGENGNKYGLLYNWYAAKLLDDNKATLFPGWHVPSLADFETLTTSCGGGSVAGGKLKSTTGWKNNGNGTDEFGFAAYPAGYYDANTPKFRSVGGKTDFMNIDINDLGYGRNIIYYSSNLLVGGQNTKIGLSLRLVKDSA